MSRGEGKLKAPTTKEGTHFAVAGQPFKNFQKNFENPLDKIPNLWYNKYVIKGRKPLKIKNERGRYHD